MKTLSANEMRGIDGGGTLCGIAVGALAGATLMYGFVGFAFMVNKTATACALDAIF